MIDKLNVHIPIEDFRLQDDPDSRWDLNEQTVSSRTTGIDKTVNLCKTVSGSQVVASKLWVNTTNANITINAYGMSMGFNPNRLANGHNAFSPDQKNLTKALDVLQEEVSGIVDFDINSAQINRIDLCRNHEMDHHPKIYTDHMANFIKAKRMPATQFPDGVRMGNKSKEFTDYNKLKELEARHNMDYLKIKSLNLGENVLRFESKFRNKKAVIRVFENSTIGGIRTLSQNDLTDIYHMQVRSNLIVKLNDSSLALSSFSSQLEEMMFLREHYSRDVISKYFEIAGYKTRIEEAGGLDQLEFLFQKAGLHRLTIQRAMEKIKLNMARYLMIEKDQIPMEIVVKELTSKLLLAA